MVGVSVEHRRLLQSIQLPSKLGGDFAVVARGSTVPLPPRCATRQVGEEAPGAAHSPSCSSDARLRYPGSATVGDVGLCAKSASGKRFGILEWKVSINLELGLMSTEEIKSANSYL